MGWPMRTLTLFAAVENGAATTALETDRQQLKIIREWLFGNIRKRFACRTRALLEFASLSLEIRIVHLVRLDHTNSNVDCKVRLHLGLRFALDWTAIALALAAVVPLGIAVLVSHVGVRIAEIRVETVARATRVVALTSRAGRIAAIFANVNIVAVQIFFGRVATIALGFRFGIIIRVELSLGIILTARKRGVPGQNEKQVEIRSRVSTAESQSIIVLSNAIK
jgi:hypothetical protein